MEHEEFIESFCRVTGYKSYEFFVPQLDSWINSRWLTRKLAKIELTQETYYTSITGLGVHKCNNPDCIKQVEFDKISRGWFDYCCLSCHKSHMWSEDDGTRLQIARSNIKMAQKFQKDNDLYCYDINSRPDFVLKKNLHRYRNYESLKFYIIIFGEYMKFGITCSEIYRVDSLLEKLDGELYYLADLDMKLACEIESELYSIGTPPDIDILRNGGRLEIRPRTSLSDIYNYILKRVSDAK